LKKIPFVNPVLCNWVAKLTMNNILLNWLKNNIGKVFPSQREGAYSIKIVGVDEEIQKVHVEFIGGGSALPIFFSMFDRALAYLGANKDRIIRLGARVKEPFDPDTIEGKLWERPVPYPTKTPYKSSPHVCDILVVAGFAEYSKCSNPNTGRIVQGVRCLANTNPTVPVDASNNGRGVKEEEKKELFIKEYKQSIIEWVEKNERTIVSARLGYSWINKSVMDCVRERNELSKAVIQSRIRNCGGVDLATLDRVTKWGFNREFPLRDPENALKVTKRAFDFLDMGNLIEATITLLNIPHVGISRASKILGLFDQDNLCIYDSRVGSALKDMKHKNNKIVLSPSGRNRPGDLVTSAVVWAQNYQKLIWTLEIIRDCLNQKGFTYRLADVEMALFMIGKNQTETLKS
jgi:hypothetical protein